MKYEFVGLSVLGESLTALVSVRYLPPTSIPGRPEADHLLSRTANLRKTARDEELRAFGFPRVQVN